MPIAGLYSVGRNGEFAHILMEDVYWRTLAKTRDMVAFLEGQREAAESPSPRSYLTAY
jgi:hypothetical protein